MAIKKLAQYVAMFVALLSIAMLVGCGASDTATSNASIKGVFKLNDKVSGLWDGITVTVTGPENFVPVLTAMDGSFTIANVSKSGTYKVQATKAGYMKAAISPITVAGIAIYDIKDYLDGPSGNVLIIGTAPTGNN